MNKEIKKIIKDWDKLETYKTNLKPENYEKNDDLYLETEEVILLLDRQKPSIIASYDFDEERIGITKSGKILWGFDSGCSCPIPWNDYYPKCYNISKTWKEFEINSKDFDTNWKEECEETIKNILNFLKGG